MRQPPRTHGASDPLPLPLPQPVREVLAIASLPVAIGIDICSVLTSYIASTLMAQRWIHDGALGA